jgi:hypothetical protein
MSNIAWFLAGAVSGAIVSWFVLRNNKKLEP